ncbi:MAG TPA: AMP-binding protein, partial [Stellaceae bacterium]|nr:AMP-binding protein [Stellaceae bacterium]
TLIDRYEVKATVGATPFLQELLDAAEAAGSRLASLKAFACGGAPVPPSLIRRANGLFASGRAFRVFGSTEAPLVTMGFMGPGEAELAAVTDGKIIDYEVKIADEDGVALPTGEDGEILARGPSLFLGYLDAKQTADAFDAEGYFRTGDVGHRTADEAIVITARKKDLIIRGGENISPKEIEDALHRHPNIQEAAAVSMPHARLGETVCVYVVARAGAQPTLATVTEHLGRLGIAKQKYPERLELVEEFPRTPAGKIRKDVLRARIAVAIGLDQPLKERT